MRQARVGILFLMTLCAICLSSGLVAASPVPDAGKIVTIDGIGQTVLPGGIDFVPAVGTENMQNLEIQYDLTGTGGDSLHYARVIVYKDTRELGPVLALIDLVEFRPEMVNMLSNMGQKQVAKKLEENGAKLIEWLPASKVSILKHNGVQLGARLTLSDKLPLPMFAWVVVYPQDGKLNGMALMCPDSDKFYWQPIFKQIFSSIVPN